ncbi:MAG TPA: hypothetical protein VL172_21940 [Kofleriaceae bacterium]|jgi:hypothetical protein|nr:hypothetical protein [Kofleriaceae bacterium]
MGPYREAVATDVLEAPTRDGKARLEVGPRSTVLELVGESRVSITNGFVAVQPLARKRKARSRTLANRRLLVARADASAEIGLWYEVKPEVMERIFGLRPPELLDRGAYDAWQQLDRLYQRLAAALREAGGGPAIEYGRGADRVLVTDDGERYVIYVRRLFRERPRRALEVGADGTVRVPGRRDDARLSSRFAVTVSGDAIAFADGSGRDLARVWLPWITHEERQALAARLGDRIDRPQPPAPVDESAYAWASALRPRTE